MLRAVIIWVQVLTVQHNLQVEVGAGTLSGAAHCGDHVPALYLLAGGDGDAGTVGIAGLIPVFVLNHHTQAVGLGLLAAALDRKSVV